MKIGNEQTAYLVLNNFKSTQWHTLLVLLKFYELQCRLLEYQFVCFDFTQQFVQKEHTYAKWFRSLEVSIKQYYFLIY